MTPQEIRDAIAADQALAALAASRADDGAIAAALSAGRTKVVSRLITERAVRALAVSPASRYALLQTLKDAATTPPAWMPLVMTGAGVPAEDQPAYMDDLSSAWRWLTQEGGLDVGTAAARALLDMISAGVTASAAACAAVKALAVEPDPVTVNDVVKALEGQ